MIRENLYSSLLELLALNTDHPLPQRIFEVGDIATFAGTPDGAERPRELRMIAGALCATRAGYSDGRSVLDALLHELGFDSEQEPEYRADDNPTALAGRSAAVCARRNGESLAVAEVFEVHPQVLENWRLSNPVVLFSLTLGEVEYF